MKRDDVENIGEERTGAEPSTVAAYRNESGELYADDVDQHMAILPEVVRPAAEIFLEYIQVGDPGEILSSDQEKLRQLIWANRHLLIGKGNTLPPRLVEHSVISMYKILTRSHKATNSTQVSQKAG